MYSNYQILVIQRLLDLMISILSDFASETRFILTHFSYNFLMAVAIQLIKRISKQKINVIVLLEKVNFPPHLSYDKYINEMGVSK
jgi:hypothetical protein